jgi:hypothetical protein
MRNVPTAIQTALDSGVTTMTYILRIDPIPEGFDSFGITLLDRNVDYDDGDGALEYLAPIGMVPANITGSSEMEVGNTEIQHLFPEFDLPISEADISAGVYDFATYHYYMVDYSNLTTGNHVVLGYGQLGQMRMQDGLSFTTELTDLTKLLMQSIVEKDSITCRATFGSQPIGTGGGVVEERFPCGKDAESLYTGPHAVTSVGAEINNTFTASGLAAAANTYVPVADADQLNTPGATVGSSLGGGSTTP